MSIATDKTRIEGAKTSLSTWLTNHGVSVPSGTKFDGLVSLLDNISVGGSNVKVATGTFSPSNDISRVTITHNLGVTPQIAFCCVSDCSWDASNDLMLFVFGADAGFNESPHQNCAGLYTRWDSDYSLQLTGYSNGEHTYELTATASPGFSYANSSTIRVSGISGAYEDEYGDEYDLYFVGSTSYFWVVIGGLS